MSRSRPGISAVSAVLNYRERTSHPLRVSGKQTILGEPHLRVRLVEFLG